MVIMNELAADRRVTEMRGGESIRANDLYTGELLSLLHIAEALVSRDRMAEGFNVLAIDVVRDALLNYGGLGHVPSSIAVQSSSLEASYSRLLRRRAQIPYSLFAWREPIDLGAAQIACVEEDLALALHKGLHYLGSARPDGVHLGLFAPEARDKQSGILLALASLHVFDLDNLVPSIIAPAEVAGTRIVSRILALPCAPRNAMSRLLGGVFAWLRRHEPDIDTLVTYNNPNLGFSGTIYRATNWVLAGAELKRADMLLDGAYVSLRELRSRFGSFCFNDLRKLLGAKLEALPTPTQPLQIYLYRLHSRARRNARIELK